MSGGKVMLFQLVEQVSKKGNAYLSGHFGGLRVLAFRATPTADEPPTWNVYIRGERKKKPAADEPVEDIGGEQ